MKLRTQILALIIVPAIGIGIVATLGGLKSWEAFQHVKYSQDSLSLTAPVAELVHEMQVERGISAGFVGSGGTNFADRLPPQRMRVDQALRKVETLDASLTEDFREQFNALQTHSSNLKSIRSQIDVQALSVSDLAEYYTKTISIALDLNNATFSQMEDLSMVQGGAAFIQLSAAKEAAGLERAMGATGFGAGAFPTEIYVRFVQFGNLQVTLLNQAALFARTFETNVAFFENVEYAAVDGFRDVVKASSGTDVQGIAAPDWFKASTAWVNRLRDYEVELAQTLNGAAEVAIAKTRNRLIAFVAASLLCLSFALAAGISVLRAFMRGISGLTEAMTQIAKKNFDVVMPDMTSQTEIGTLSRTLDGMRNDLRSVQDAAVEGAFSRMSFDISGAPLFLVDTDFNITKMNRAATSMMSLRADDFRTLIPDFDPTALVGKNMDICHVMPQKARKRLSRPDSLPLELKISVGEAFLGLFLDSVSDDDGNELGYILEWKDQTDLMVHQTIMNAIDSQQVRVTARLNGHLKSANALAQEVFGLTGEAPSGFDLAACLRGLDSDRNVWDEVRAGSTVFSKFKLLGGVEDRVLEGSLSPVPDHKGQLNGVLLLCVDVTAAHSAQAAAELDQKTRAREQLNVVDCLSASLKRMANGDLTCRIETEFAPDYEQLRADFNGAIGNLLSAICNVVDNAGEIGVEANSISTSVGDLSRRTEQQAATLEETAAAVEELTTSVNSAARGAKDAASIASAARLHAESSGEIVKNAVAAMNEIERSSVEISKIISVIDDIAFQTNLLALNAGVEAARAGESGRGFAVVASEVRGLAQRSLEAASEISSLITASGASVDHGVSLVGSTGEALEEIVGSVAEISDLVNNIAVSAAEQSSGISEINSAMNDLETTTQRNAAMAEETTAATLALAGESKALVTVTAQFHIGDGASQPSAAGTAARGSFDAAQMSERHDIAETKTASVGNTALKHEFVSGGWEDF